MLRRRSSPAFVAAVAAVIGGLALVMACSSPYAPVLNENSRNERLWDGQKITDYKYTVALTKAYSPPPAIPPDYPPPVVVQVRGGGTRSVTYLRGGESVPPGLIYHDANIVDKLFVIVRQAAESKPHAIETQYDQLLGYPTRITIEYRQDKEERFVDEWTITDFEILK
jgi:hypothetical protein